MMSDHSKSILQICWPNAKQKVMRRYNGPHTNAYRVVSLFMGKGPQQRVSVSI